jgi:SNF2 family DNA or RNA helicase
MNWNPHHYQEEAIAFAMKRDGCGLMLDPGMGKTSITLACIDILRSAGEIKKTLVVAPLRVCNTVWPVEARKWQDFHALKVCNLCEHPTKFRGALINDPTHHVYCINPESLVKVLPLLGPDFDLLVLDESTKFKDTQTQRFKALKKVLHNFKRRMILTGTPVPNGLADLFGQMYVVDFGGSLGKYVSHFRMEFMHQRPGDAYGWHLNRGAPDMIYKRVANRLMRLDAKDHLQMPELVNNFITVQLPAALRKQYDDLEDDFVSEMEDVKVAVFNPAALGSKLRQMANGFIYDNQGGMTNRRAYRLHSEKLDALQELVEEMQGRPLFVAYEFEEDWEMIRDRFNGQDLPLAVNLGKEKDPEKVVQQFNAGLLPLVVAHPASVGHGLNLQEACNTVCWYGITWNLEHYIQFIDRVYRQGQKAATVVVHHIVCQGTKDEDVTKALEGKDRTQTRFNDAIKKVRA